MNYFRKIITSLSLIAAVFMTSCGSQKTVSTKKARSTEGLDKYNSNYEYVKDKNGLMRATSDKKSQFGNNKSFAGARDLSGKDYNKKSYRKKRWGQKSDYSTQQYQGRKESNLGGSPYYVQQARMNNRNSRFSYNQYGTNGYKTNNAREGSNGQRNSNVSRGPSGYVTAQGDYPEPLIMSKQQYTKYSRQKLTVKQTNIMLGR